MELVRPKGPTTIAIVSGKGGVGKSVVAVNLAETLAETGARVALVDVDFGQGACAVLVNETPASTVYEWSKRRGPVADLCLRTAAGVTLVQGAAGPLPLRETASLLADLDRVVTALRANHDYVLLDAPAGLDGPVRWALDAADLGLLVLAGEPTAVADAYRLARLVWESDPGYALCAVVNLADTEDDARSVSERFGAITERFTGRCPDYLGWVPYAAEMRRAVRAQTPAVRAPGSMRQAFGAVAAALGERQSERFPLGL
ncbi:MAG: AAA family ATPase [Bacteroidota bacterium]